MIRQYATFNFWRRRAEAILSLQRDYENWMDLARDYLLGHSVREAVLRKRCGLKLPHNVSISNLLALPVLLEHEWSIISGDSDLFVLIEPTGLQFKCRAKKALDVGHLVEIYINKGYKSNLPNGIVLDAGMSNGDSSIYFGRTGSKQVIGLEPFADSFTLAKENILLNQMQDTIIPLNMALAASGGEAELKFNNIDKRKIALLGSMLRGKHVIDNVIMRQSIITQISLLLILLTKINLLREG